MDQRPPSFASPRMTFAREMLSPTSVSFGRLAARVGTLALFSLALPIPVDASDSASATGQPLSVDAPTSFTRNHVEKQRDLERRLRARISRERMRADLERLASKPHRAGSAAGREIAHFIAAELRGAGLDAEVVEYVHYLSSPGSWKAHQPRNLHARLVEGRLTYQVVIAQVVTMIGGEYDNGVFEQALVSKGLDNLAHLVVDLLNRDVFENRGSDLYKPYTNRYSDTRK